MQSAWLSPAFSPAPWSPCGQELAPWRLPSVEQEAGWGQQPCILLQGSQGDSKNAKKKNNKKTNKNKSSISRANKKKPSMPNVSNDLSQKLYATMEKHKEVRAGRAGCWPPSRELATAELSPWDGSRRARSFSSWG